MPSNIAATSPGCFSRSARAMTPPYGAAADALSLQEAGALPFLAEDVLGEEGEDGLVPDSRVAGGEDPVVLVGKVEELGLGAGPGQVPPQPQRLAHRHPVVLVAVDDQHRGADPVDVPVR